MCDIKLGNLVLLRGRGQSQADSKEVIYTLIKGSKFRAETPEDQLLHYSTSDGAGVPGNMDSRYQRGVMSGLE